MKVVGLKSVIAEQERKQEDEDLSINPRKVRSERNDNSKRTRKVTNPKKENGDDRNPGVEERIRRDEEEIKGNTMKEKLRKLEEKAERFHAMQRGLYEMGW